MPNSKKSTSPLEEALVILRSSSPKPTVNDFAELEKTKKIFPPPLGRNHAEVSLLTASLVCIEKSIFNIFLQLVYAHKLDLYEWIFML